MTANAKDHPSAPAGSGKAVSSGKAAAADPNQDLAELVSSNLKKLIAQNDITQKELAEMIGVAPASMTDYCKGRRLSTVFDKQMMETYHKYCATYLMYYFDTSKSKGRDLQLPRDSLHYGVLFIYENPTSLEAPQFGCAAILGIKDRGEVTRLKADLDKMEVPEKVIEHIGSKYESMAYYGDFSLTQYHAFVSMSHANTDKALLIFHRVDNNKSEYIGGIGTINSVSKGREHMPVVQYLGISRYPLALSVEEIHHNLLLDYPTFEADPEMVDEMIKNFKALYADPNSAIGEGF